MQFISSMYGEQAAPDSWMMYSAFAALVSVLGALRILSWKNELMAYEKKKRNEQRQKAKEEKQTHAKLPHEPAQVKFYDPIPGAEQHEVLLEEKKAGTHIKFYDPIPGAEQHEVILDEKKDNL
jgi:hypothetical protein